MATIKETIANNIVELRKGKKWTQAELAEHLNYSDKAISKWERAESMPDVDSLFALSNLFQVPVDYFFHEDSKQKVEYIKVNKQNFVNKLLIFLLFCIAALCISMVVFVWGYLKDPSQAYRLWVSFLWATPVISILYCVFSKTIKSYLNMMIALSCFIWTLLASIYFTVLLYGTDNVWIIFFVNIPIQAAILLVYFLKYYKK